MIWGTKEKQSRVESRSGHALTVAEVLNLCLRLVPIPSRALRLGGRLRESTGPEDPMKRAPPPIPRGRILIADRQRNMRMTTALVLRYLGHTVIEVDSAEAALATLSTEKVDVLITRLKTMSALSWLPRARELNPLLYITLMSIASTQELEAVLRTRVADDYIRPPFREGALEAWSERVMRRVKL
jgi:CheY-like chemotaxis protein